MYRYILSGLMVWVITKKQRLSSDGPGRLFSSVVYLFSLTASHGFFLVFVSYKYSENKFAINIV